MELALGLILALATLPIFGFAIVIIVWWMFDGRIDTIPGFAVIAALLTAFGICMAANNGIVSGAVIVSTISLLVLYPFAERQLDATELRGMNVDLIDRSHEALSQRPDNVAAAFQLARSLYNYGMRGHAIAIADQTLARVQPTIDPRTGRPGPDHFRNERLEVESWKRDSQDPNYYKPLKCPKCNMFNPPGELACKRCQGPYLLELAREADPRTRSTAKILISWALIATIIPISAYVGLLTGGGGTSILVVLIGIALIGFILYRLFKLAPGETGEVRRMA